MIAEEKQDLAALYVLDLLEASETAAFEAAMREDAELREFVNQLRETVGSMALTMPARPAPAGVKSRVTAAIASETQTPSSNALGARPITPHPMSWLPWAIAALLFVSLGASLYNNLQMRREIAQMRGADPLMQTNFVPLAPSKEGPADAKAMVAWQADKQSGVIHVEGLPAAGKGKDYQLWVVDAEHKDPIDAGMVHVEEDGTAQVRFKPADPAHQVKAFALSLEREGGAPKREGPIVLIGNA
jgi:anti-sigma-K factor RskA